MAAPLELPGYAVLDVYTEYRVLNNWRIFLDIRNILDKEYVDINGFTTRPINLMTGLSFSF
jgi:outer membrane receptor protein involved in Fe transport